MKLEGSLPHLQQPATCPYRLSLHIPSKVTFAKGYIIPHSTTVK